MQMKKQVKQFIDEINVFNIETVLQLFADDAIIDDVSVGRKFSTKKGVKEYLETFFVGYNTKTRLDSIEVTADFNVSTKVDFTGDFGHEKGGLKFSFNQEGLITRVDAYLD